MTQAGRRGQGALWAVASALCFSVSTPLGKYLLKRINVPSLMLWRFGLAAVLTWIVVLAWRRRGGPDPFAVPRRLTVLVLGAWFGLMVTVGYFALARLPGSTYIVLIYTYPAMVAVATALLGTSLGVAVWGALAVTMTGTVLTVPDVLTDWRKVDGVGVACTLVQAVMLAGYIIASGRVVPPGQHGLVTAAWMLPGSALAVVPIAVATGIDVPDGIGVWWRVVLMAALSTVLATLTFFLALASLAPPVVAMISTLEIAFAIAWSVVFIGESLRPVQVAGAVIVGAGVAWAQYAEVASGHEAEVTVTPLP